MLLTYDITREETFLNLAEWIREIKTHSAEDVKIYLVGNKSELEDAREVSLQMAIDFAKTNNVS